MASLLHQEICRLRVAKEESCRRPRCRWRQRLWTASLDRVHALLSDKWQRPATGEDQATVNKSTQTRS